MKDFLQKLWSSPLKGSLLALPALLLGFVVNYLAGAKGEISIPAQTVVDILLLWGSSLFAVCGVAFSYWKRCQPADQIEAAHKQGRPICHCTVDGVVMLIDTDPKKRDINVGLYVCPKCGSQILKETA